MRFQSVRVYRSRRRRQGGRGRCVNWCGAHENEGKRRNVSFVRRTLRGISCCELRRVGKGKAPGGWRDRLVKVQPRQGVASRPGGECCVSLRRPRSVHSCCAGCVIEPRNTHLAGGGGIPLLPNATWTGPLCEVLFTLPGSKSRSRAERSCRKLGGPASDRHLWKAAVRIGKARSRSR